MVKKQTVRNFIVGGMVMFGFCFGAVAAAPSTYAASCGGVETSIIQCGGSKDATDLENTGLWNLLLQVINILTYGVGILAVAGVIYGGLVYSSSAGKPEQVTKARTIFTNVVLGVIAYAGMFALLNYIVPGGVFQTTTATSCDTGILGVPPWYKGLTDGEPGSCAIQSPSDVKNFVWKVVLNGIDIALVVSAYIAVGFIIYGGFLWLVGGARPDMISRGRKTIMNAAIGLIITMAAIGLTNLIFGIIK